MSSPVDIFSIPCFEISTPKVEARLSLNLFFTKFSGSPGNPCMGPIECCSASVFADLGARAVLLVVFSRLDSLCPVEGRFDRLDAGEVMLGTFLRSDSLNVMEGRFEELDAGLSRSGDGDGWVAWDG